jgi:hypothetical protein
MILMHNLALDSLMLARSRSIILKQRLCVIPPPNHPQQQSSDVSKTAHAGVPLGEPMHFQNLPFIGGPKLRVQAVFAFDIHLMARPLGLLPRLHCGVSIDP